MDEFKPITYMCGSGVLTSFTRWNLNPVEGRGVDMGHHMSNRIYSYYCRGKTHDGSIGLTAPAR